MRKSSFPDNETDYMLGYSSMMAPTCSQYQNKVLRMFEVHSFIEEQQGDLHFFEYKEHDDKWVLIPQMSLINLEGNERLIDTYMQLPKDEEVDYDVFLRLIFYTLYF